MGEDYSCASLLCFMIVLLFIIIPFGVKYFSLIPLLFCVLLSLACCCSICLLCIQCFRDLYNYIITQEGSRAYSRPQSRYSHQVALRNIPQTQSLLLSNRIEIAVKDGVLVRREIATAQRVTESGEIEIIEYTRVVATDNSWF